MKESNSEKEVDSSPVICLLNCKKQLLQLRTIFHSYLNDWLKYAKLLQEWAANAVDSDNCEAVESTFFVGNYFCSLSYRSGMFSTPQKSHVMPVYCPGIWYILTQTFPGCESWRTLLNILITKLQKRKWEEQWVKVQEGHGIFWAFISQRWLIAAYKMEVGRTLFWCFQPAGLKFSVVATCLLRIPI